MPIPSLVSSSSSRPGPKLEDNFQPILPKVDHILSLIREHQEQLQGAEGISDGNSKQGRKEVVDLEDKIIKEVSSSMPLKLASLRKRKANSYSMAMYFRSNRHLLLDCY
jgi:hypothetical protein